MVSTPRAAPGVRESVGRFLPSVLGRRGLLALTIVSAILAVAYMAATWCYVGTERTSLLVSYSVSALLTGICSTVGLACLGATRTPRPEASTGAPAAAGPHLGTSGSGSPTDAPSGDDRTEEIPVVGPVSTDGGGRPAPVVPSVPERPVRPVTARGRPGGRRLRVVAPERRR